MKALRREAQVIGTDRDLREQNGKARELKVALSIFESLCSALKVQRSKRSTLECPFPRGGLFSWFQARFSGP